MSSFEQDVVSANFAEASRASYPGQSLDEAFARYATDLRLKHHDIEVDALERGLTDDDQDRGIDAAFTFFQGALVEPGDDLVDEPEHVPPVASSPSLELFVFQHKNKTRWEQTAVERLGSALPKLLDYQANDVSLSEVFGNRVVEQTRPFRRVLSKYRSHYPAVLVHVVYATQALESNVTPVQEDLAQGLRESVLAILPRSASVDFQFCGAESLYRLEAEDPVLVRELAFSELIRSDSSYLGLATLRDYVAFATDSNGRPVEALFAANVRDFEGQGKNVNAAISRTLRDPGAPNFWWLNNGITIIADRVDGPQRTLSMRRPYVVNGLQTTHVLASVAVEGSLSEIRGNDYVLVRIVETGDDSVRDRIIESTNNQTAVNTLSLFATRDEQRDLERYLRTVGWFYERRKNAYRWVTPRVPKARVVSIRTLGQVLISLLLEQPHTARARPGNALTKEESYQALYLVEDLAYVAKCGLDLLAKVNAYLGTSAAREVFNSPNNVRYYLVFAVAFDRLGGSAKSGFDFAHRFRTLDDSFGDDYLGGLLSVIADVARKLQSERDEDTLDRVFRSSDMTRRLVAALAVRSES